VDKFGSLRHVKASQGLPESKGSELSGFKSDGLPVLVEPDEEESFAPS